VEDWAPHIGVGNFLAGIAWDLLKSEQCGHNRTFVLNDLEGRRKEVAEKGHSQFLYLDAMDELFGLPLVAEGNKTAVCSTDTLQDTTLHTADFPPWNITRSLFHRRLFPLLKQQKLLAQKRALLRDALVVHLRGSDIMPRGDLDYLPAPCTFVDRVIKGGHNGQPYKQIIMVSDSSDHPCIHYVKIRHQNAHFKPNRAIDDLYTLISAQNLVLSTSSTFGLAATFLNPGKDLRIYLPTYRGHKLCCEGNFNPSRFSQLCQISGHSQIWEFNAPERPYLVNRTAWILEARNVKTLTMHTCS